MRSYTFMSPWILTDFITLINEPTNRWTVSGFQDSHNMKPPTLVHVECFIHCLFLHTANDPKFKHLPFVAISRLRISDDKLMDPFLVIFFSMFWLQLRNLLLLCEPREFMHLMKLFFKNSADEVENAPKSPNSQGFHTTFIFGNFTDDIGSMRTLKTPTLPGTLNTSSYGTLAAQLWKWECVMVASSAITQCCNHTHTHTFNTLKTEETS